MYELRRNKFKMGNALSRLENLQVYKTIPIMVTNIKIHAERKPELAPKTITNTAVKRPF